MTSRSCSTRSSAACDVAGRSPISSRNSVPPSAERTNPDLVARRARERALHVAEEQALDERRRQRSAVDGDERASPRRLGVDLAGEDLLARTGGAEEEDGDRALAGDPAEGRVALLELRKQGAQTERVPRALRVLVAHHGPVVRRSTAHREEHPPGLDDVALAQHVAGDALPVDEGAVARARVLDDEVRAYDPDAGVLRREPLAGQPHVERAAVGAASRDPCVPAAERDRVDADERIPGATPQRSVPLEDDEEDGCARAGPARGMGDLVEGLVDGAQGGVSLAAPFTLHASRWEDARHESGARRAREGGSGGDPAGGAEGPARPPRRAERHRSRRHRLPRRRARCRQAPSPRRPPSSWRASRPSTRATTRTRAGRSRRRRKKNPKNYEALFDLGQTCEKLGDKPAAEAAYKARARRPARPRHGGGRAQLRSTSSADTPGRRAGRREGRPREAPGERRRCTRTSASPSRRAATRTTRRRSCEAAVKAQPTEPMYHLTLAHWLNTWKVRGADAAPRRGARTLVKDDYGDARVDRASSTAWRASSTPA